jgi:hypothetical protein
VAWTAGHFSAAAARKSTGLDVADDTPWHSYSQAAGNRQCIVDGALTKRLQAGQAASSGVLAAILAREGFTGAQEVFAGRYGFFPMYQPEGYNLEAITASLGTAFRGEELSFKPYPCGRGHHAILMPRWPCILRWIWRLRPRRRHCRSAGEHGCLHHAEQLPLAQRNAVTQVVEAQFSIPFLVAGAGARACWHWRGGRGGATRVLALAARLRPARPMPQGWAAPRCVVQMAARPRGPPCLPLPQPLSTAHREIP